MSALQLATKLICHFEGCPKNSAGLCPPYLDEGGIPTIGWGNTVLLNGQRVTMETPPITPAEADQLMETKVQEFMNGVSASIRVPVNDNQLAALTSFAYNVGLGNFSQSTLLRDLNAGNYQAAAGQFPNWDLIRGVRSQGLWNRREEEEQDFNQPS
ncbi:MAG: lysozyme [Negativicutes bacterium]|nr:lysozyme [Negativicutes bacterium]